MSLHHAAPREVVDLRPLGPALKDAKTAAIVKTDRFEAIRLVVRAGEKIPTHSVAGHMTLHCLEGRAKLGLEGGDLELTSGAWVYLERGETHSVEGLEDALLLLTILFEPGA